MQFMKKLMNVSAAAEYFLKLQRAAGENGAPGTIRTSDPQIRRLAYQIGEMMGLLISLNKWGSIEKVLRYCSPLFALCQRQVCCAADLSPMTFIGE